ncbi:unnamed protein product [Prunus armeniaca]
MRDYALEEINNAHLLTPEESSHEDKPQMIPCKLSPLTRSTDRTAEKICSVETTRLATSGQGCGKEQNE